MRNNWLVIAGLLGSVVGCADVIGVSERTRIETGPRMNYQTEDPPTDWPVRVRYAHTGVYLSGEVMGHMRYDAYHASISGTANVTDDRGTGSFTFSPQEQHHFAGFIGNEFKYTWSVPIYRKCGTHLRGDLNYRAWWQGIGTSGQFALMSDSQSRDAQVSQQDCPTEDVHEPSGGNGGGGGAATEIAEEKKELQEVTMCVVRYTYDLETGEVLSWSVLYCY